MTVSVITVTFNAAATVDMAVRSVLEQSGDFRLDYHIVDGGSTDGTLDVLKAHQAGIAQITSGPDNGLYDAMNRGVARAKGDIIGILNADDAYADHRSSPMSCAPLRKPAPTGYMPIWTTWTKRRRRPSHVNGNQEVQATFEKGGCPPTLRSLSSGHCMSNMGCLTCNCAVLQTTN